MPSSTAKSLTATCSLPDGQTYCLPAEGWSLHYSSGGWGFYNMTGELLYQGHGVSTLAVQITATSMCGEDGTDAEDYEA